METVTVNECHNVSNQMQVGSLCDSLFRQTTKKHHGSALPTLRKGNILVTDGHYNDVMMTTMASQITSLTVVYSTVYSDGDQRKHQSSASLAFVWGIHRDRWIPRTKGQLRGKCFHLMTSSCFPCEMPVIRKAFPRSKNMCGSSYTHHCIFYPQLFTVLNSQ